MFYRKSAVEYLLGLNVVSTVAEVDAAIHKLDFPSGICRRLPDAEARPVFQRALDKFVGGDDRRWWWERFGDDTLSRQVTDGWKYLSALAPKPDELLWFIVEDDELPFYPVYEATPRAIEKLIGECSCFEYYLVAKDMSWLLCENHHDCLIGVGSQVTSRLAGLIA